MNIVELTTKMENSLKFFEKELTSIRTSRANPTMLDNILVDAYGSKCPINQLGNISISDASTLTIQVFDQSMVKSIEAAISDSNLGINPQNDGVLIRLPVPKLSEERRNDLSKIASQYAENSKVAIRNIRREALDQLKKDEKDKIISQDDSKKKSTQVQNITDEYIKKIDDVVSIKKNEIITV